MTLWTKDGFALATKTFPRLTMVGSIKYSSLIDNLTLFSIGHSYHHNWGLIITGGGTYKPTRINHDEIEVTDDGESFSIMPFKVPGLDINLCTNQQ